MSRPEEVAPLSKDAFRLTTPFEFSVVSGDCECHGCRNYVYSNSCQKADEVGICGRVHDDETSIHRYFQVAMAEWLRICMASQSVVRFEQMDIAVDIFQCPCGAQACAA